MSLAALPEVPAESLEDLVRRGYTALAQRDLKLAGRLLETAALAAPAAIATELHETLATILVLLNDDRAIVRLLARSNSFAPHAMKARLLLLRNRRLGIHGEEPAGSTLDDLKPRLWAHVVAGVYKPSDLLTIASLLAQLDEGDLARQILTLCAEKRVRIDEATIERTLIALMGEHRSQEAVSLLGVLTTLPNATELPLRRWWRLLRGDGPAGVDLPKTTDKVLKFMERLASAPRPGREGSHGNRAGSTSETKPLRPQSLIGGLPSVRASVYRQYLPDSVYCFAAHPEFVDLLPRFVKENAQNNGGDLARLIAMVLNIKHVLEENVPGDFAELGVWRGNTAAVLASFAARNGRRAFLFDTFEGFDERDEAREPTRRGSGGRAQFSDTSLALAQSVVDEPSPSIHWVKGYFPASLQEAHRQARYAVVNLDCDLYEPMKAGLDFFYPRMPVGGLLLLHDYGSMFWGGAKQAIDEFLKRTGERAVLMPDKSGSAFVRKCLDH